MHAPRCRSLGPALVRLSPSFFRVRPTTRSLFLLESAAFPRSLLISINSVLLFDSNGYTQSKLLTCITFYAKVFYETCPPAFLLRESSAHSASLREIYFCFLCSPAESPRVFPLHTCLNL